MTLGIWSSTPLFQLNKYSRKHRRPPFKKLTATRNMMGVKLRKDMIFVAKKKESSKEARIKTERQRLIEVYKEIPVKEFKTAEKLIDNVAFMSITLEDLMDIINNDELVKTTVNASQTFMKEHPAITAYNKMYANFLKGIQQLSSLLPKNYGDLKPVEDSDEFLEFMNGKK